MTQSSGLIADFLDTLTGLATGSYLREEEREHWDPPYPPEVVGAAEEIFHQLTAEIQREPAEISLAVISAYNAFSTLNERHGRALIEKEEEDDLRAIIAALAEESDHNAATVLADLDHIIDQED